MKTIILPGLIDIHVHLRTPGQTEKEDFTTGTKAAIAGGFTTVFDMPNNKIPITTVERLNEKKELAKGHVYSDIGFYFGSLGDNLDEFAKVANDIYGLKLYLNETTGNFLISKEKLEEIFVAWKKATSLRGGNDEAISKPILVHAEDDAVAAVINNARKTGQQVHFCHISLQSDLEQIMRAKDEGLAITCGIAPHHLFLNRADAEKLGPYGRMKPFLKSEEDVKFLWDHIDSIDVVESDHAPHTRTDKDSDTPPFGVPGLETTLPLLFTAVHEGKLKITDVTRLCHENPMKILNLKHDTGEIEVEIDEEYEISNDNLNTKAGWTPFAGRKVFGKVRKVELHNETIFDNGDFPEKPQGKVI